MKTSVFKQDLLQGKVALITGGGTGINFGIARALGQHGSKIVITGRRKQVLEKATAQLEKEGITAYGIQSDVRSYADCTKAVETTVTKYGKIDILVNGAAGNFLCASEDLTPNGFKTVMEIDAFGTFNMSQASFAALKASKQGVIINISATLHYTATIYQLPASAAKASVDAMTRNLAAEWGKYGIRSVGIAPGPISDTEGMTRLSGGDEERRNYLKGTIALRRLGLITDIAQTAVFLASPAANYISGQTIVVDGGASLYTPPFVSEDAYAAIAAHRKSKL